ncbi:MAG: tryptophan-rich sensory protein [Lachnospiraceae bacterium]|nr:tryptophan-rich sensory protein [Lachnospiraceae bacterium]
MGKTKDSKKFDLILVLCLLIPLAIGGASAFVSLDGFKTFGDLKKPPFTPEGWMFIVVWSVLYLLMGAVCYMIVKDKVHKRAGVLTIYVLQLIFNGIWCPLFFGQGWYWISAVWLIVLVGLIAILVMMVWRIRKGAALLLLPYLIWSVFSLYLNIGMATLN